MYCDDLSFISDLFSYLLMLNAQNVQGNKSNISSEKRKPKNRIYCTICIHNTQDYFPLITDINVIKINKIDFHKKLEIYFPRHNT